jgi:hypothetical protein
MRGNRNGRAGHPPVAVTKEFTVQLGKGKPMIQLIILVLVVVGVMSLCGIKPPKWLWSFDSFRRKKKK